MNTKETLCNDELILLMAFKGHLAGCMTDFYDSREEEISVVSALCEYSFKHDLLDSDTAKELASYIELKGYRSKIKKGDF